MSPLPLVADRARLHSIGGRIRLRVRHRVLAVVTRGAYRLDWPKTTLLDLVTRRRVEMRDEGAERRPRVRRDQVTAAHMHLAQLRRSPGKRTSEKSMML